MTIPREHIWYEVASPEADAQGRVTFDAYWFDPKTLRAGGPPAHVRGQVFHTTLESFTSRHEGTVHDVTADREGFKEWRLSCAEYRNEMDFWSEIRDNWFRHETLGDYDSQIYAELIRDHNNVWQLSVKEPGEDLRRHQLGDSDELEHVKKVAEATIANRFYREPAPLGFCGEQSIADVIAHGEQLNHGGHEL